MIKASNPGLFILLNYTLLSCIVVSSVLSSCAATQTEENDDVCTVMSYLGALTNCLLLMYVWYKLFTWKC